MPHENIEMRDRAEISRTATEPFAIRDDGQSVMTVDFTE
jgi:hypothetical protein